jgi:hypothetical protein
LTDAIRISHSQLGVWQDCQQKWHYGYVDKLTSKEPHANLQRGTLVHELLAVYDQFLMQGARQGSREALDAVLQFASDDISPRMVGVELENYTRALAACVRFIRDFSPAADKYIQVKAVEEYFEAELVTPRGRPFILEGYIDRMYMDTGRFWVLDRKSSSTGRHYNMEQIWLDNQLSTYAAVLKFALGYDVFGVAIDSINTYPYKEYAKEPVDKLFKRIVAPRSDRELRFSLHTYGRAVDGMIDYMESGEEPMRRLTRDCTFCQFHDLCLFTMKGLPIDGIIQSRFVKKVPRGGTNDTSSGLLIPINQASDSSKSEDRVAFNPFSTN